MSKKDLYQQVTDSIICSLEQGAAPWVQPWVGGHHNAQSLRQYRGINPLLLNMAAINEGWESQGWLTYRQAAKAGGQVRKGEKGTRITFFKMFAKECEETGEEKAFPILRSFTVFNEAQIDGLPEKEAVEQETLDPQIEEKCSLILESSKALVVIGGDKACYRPSTDEVIVPSVNAFSRKVENGVSHYWATMFHELVHWTGVKHRLDRYTINTSSEDYAFEELVAELGASYLCAAVGIKAEMQHADYIGSWLKALNNDKRFIFRAASAAQKAVDYLLEKAGMLEDFKDSSNEEAA